MGVFGEDCWAEVFVVEESFEVVVAIAIEDLHLIIIPQFYVKLTV